MKMLGFTETEFTATGPAAAGFRTLPADTATQFDIGAHVSGLNIGVKGTGTAGEQPRPGSKGTGVQGTGSGIGPGVAGVGGNATPGTIDVDPAACAGVVGAGGKAPQSGGPGVAGFGAPNGGIGVLGQGGVPGPEGAGGPGVKGIGGGDPNSDDADGVQGFGSGALSGVTGWGGSNSGAGVVGWGGGNAGAGAVGIGGPGSFDTNNEPGPGVVGFGGPGPIPDTPLEAVAAGVCGVGGSLYDPEGYDPQTGAGVVGIGNPGNQNLLAPSADGAGVYGAGRTGVIAVGTTDEFFALEAVALNGVSGYAAAFTGLVWIDGHAVINGGLEVYGGAKSAVVPFPDGTQRRLYCMESPECWFEDFGTAQLVNGQAQVQLDRGFASVVSADDYHVFLTEYDDNSGLYVTGRTSTGFGVRAKTSPTANGTFSYRVVAKRKDIVAPRFDQVTLPQPRSADQAARRVGAGRNP